MSDINLFYDVQYTLGQEKKKKQKLILFTLPLSLILSVSIVSFVLMKIFSANLVQEISSLALEESQVNKLASVKQEIKQTSDYIYALESLEQGGRQYSSIEILKRISGFIPQNVEINNFSLTGDGTISMVGTSKSEMELAQFLDAIALDTSFTDSEIGGISFSEETGCSFALNLKVRQEQAIGGDSNEATEQE